MYDSATEIFDQGESLLKTYDYIIGRRAEIEGLFRDNEYGQVLFIGCGSSYWSSLSSCVTFQRDTKTQAMALTSGDVLMNLEYHETAYKKPLIIAPSRSGATSETVSVIKRFKEVYGSKVLSITEYENSPLEELSDFNLYIPWANEISVCQTRSFSCLYLAEVMLGAIAGKNDALIENLKLYIDNTGKLLSESKAQLEKLVGEFSSCDALVTLGNGPILGVAIEGAYIAIEMAAFPSNYYPTLELRHGPIVTCNKNTLVSVFSAGNRRDLDEGMAKDARAKGSQVIYIGAKSGFENCDYTFALGFDALPETIALYGVAVMQGFAHLKSVALGLDPDHPNELVPWIRV